MHRDLQPCNEIALFPSISSKPHQIKTSFTSHAPPSKKSRFGGSHQGLPSESTGSYPVKQSLGSPWGASAACCFSACAMHALGQLRS